MGVSFEESGGQAGLAEHLEWYSGSAAEGSTNLERWCVSLVGQTLLSAANPGRQECLPHQAEKKLITESVR